MLRQLLSFFSEPPYEVNRSHYVYAMAKRRLVIVAFTILVGFLAVIIRLVDVSILTGYADESDRNRMHAKGVHTGRSVIVDRMGKILASSIATSSLYVNAKLIQNAEHVSAGLHAIFPHLKQNVLKKKLTSGKNFIWLVRHLTPQQKSAVMGIGSPALDFLQDAKRVYPFGRLASHIVGFVDVDNNGISGLERGLDDKLRSSADPIKLALDIRLQFAVRDELMKSIDRFSADGGSAMVMDIRNGEVLAMASLPDFDPNHPQKCTPESRFNRLTSGVYEMGSSMKILNSAMALDTGKMTLASKFDVRKPIKIGRFSVTDYHPINRSLTLEEVFVLSSNIGSAKIALQAGTVAQKNFLKRVGMLEAPSCELPEIGRPLVPKNWREANTITISYGYGLATSPLQMILAVSGVINQGRRVMKPYFVKHRPEDSIVMQQVVSPDVSRQVLALMRKSVTDGTSRQSEVPGIGVSGKTGTANHRKAHGRGYQKKHVNTTFVGVFPAQPRYAVFVLLDGPKGKSFTYGFNAAGWNAAPTAGNIVRRIALVLGMEPTLELAGMPDKFTKN